jgi:hypothetical protein
LLGAGVSAFQMGLIHIIAGMMGAVVFERYPRLKVLFGESGAGWLAYALHRMDFEYEDRFCEMLQLSRQVRSNHLMRRQQRQKGEKDDTDQVSRRSDILRRPARIGQADDLPVFLGQKPLVELCCALRLCIGTRRTI